MTSGVCVAMSNGAPTGDGTNEVVKLTPTPLAVDRTVGSRLEVTIPADAVSVELFAETVSDPDAEIDFARILQTTDNFATATRLYEAGSVSSPLRHFGPFRPGGIALLFPNTPMLRFMPSTNTTTVKLGVQMFASDPTTANVFASIKHAPSSMLTQGTIDLNLFFVGISDLGLTAATARTDPRFQQILTRVGQLWADSGMRFGDVSYIDVPEPDAARLTRVTDATYPEVIRQGRRGGKDWGLNMFLVNEISGGRQGFVVLGRAAGIPGVPLKGNPISGVVVTTANFKSERGIEQIAQTMAHEGGHWLGLFHPSESSGTSFDLLADTPECSAAQFDRNGDGMVDRQECAGRGAENLMFWLLGGTRISPNQKFVLLRNAIVR
jgi:hypothetical protein